MINQVNSTAKRKDSILKSNMIALTFSAAFNLQGLFEYPYIFLIAIITSAVVVCALLVFFIYKRKRQRSLVNSVIQENPLKPKPKGEQDSTLEYGYSGLPVTKVEVIDNSVKFFVAKGVRKKRWVVVKEIPVYEITSIENFGNKLTVTWKDVTDTFFMNGTAESFGKLCDEVNGMLEEHRKSTENQGKVALRRNELLALINASIGFIDLSFDILIGLQEKRINWQRLDGYSNSFGENLDFTGQTIPPLNLDFLKISSAIKTQIPKETAREAYNILKTVHEYFNGLSVDDDIKESVPNFHIAKAIILSYYTLNDFLFGKVVGDKENKKENHQLESDLQILANGTNFNVNIDELRGSIDKMIPENDLESVIDGSRGIFKEELKRSRYT